MGEAPLDDVPLYDVPRDLRTIRARMRRYARDLREEQAAYGCIRDGMGKRSLLGPLYLLLGDTAGALRSFTWCAETFPDDSGDPVYLLCWTLALYRTGDRRRAASTLRQTMLCNLYLLPRLLGREQDVIDMWHASNSAEKSSSDAVPNVWLALWDPPRCSGRARSISARVCSVCGAGISRSTTNC